MSDPAQVGGPFYLDENDPGFPAPERAHSTGLLAVGGGLDPQRLLRAYRTGIFPWPLMGVEWPMLWFSPDPRLVIYPGRFRTSRSLRREVRRGRFRVTTDTRFREVVTACAEKRPGQRGTWITGPLMDGFERLHRLGFAHSVECFVDDELVGGLYGLAIGGAFFGESMFARRSNASKVALVHLMERLRRWDFRLVDCQQTTAHMLQFGAEEIPRARFLVELEEAVAGPGRPGVWRWRAASGCR